MDPSYVNVMEVGELLYVAAVYALHGGVALAQAALACFLLSTGLRSLASSAPGVSRKRGALRAALGLLLVAPLAVGAPVAVSIAAAAAAAALLIAEGRARPPERSAARRLRLAATAFAGFAGLFMLWEREDNLALGAHLLRDTMTLRNEEVAWQLEHDPRSPKVGELAPDFELQDPSGRMRMRLSDFRGRRPVALVFGSYT